MPHPLTPQNLGKQLFAFSAEKLRELAQAGFHAHGASRPRGPREPGLDGSITNLNSNLKFSTRIVKTWDTRFSGKV